MTSKLTINDVAFRYHEVTRAEIDVLLDIARKNGVNYWGNAEYYESLGVKEKQKHVVWFQPAIVLNGVDSGLPPVGCEIVPYSTFLQLFKEHYGEPRPRYRKKRTPVPKRTVTAITINYKDGKQYVVKNPSTVYFDKDKLGINTEVVITEGIVNSVYSEIATRLVKSITIDEKDDETLIEFMPSLKKFRITGQKSRVSGAESFYKYFK